METELLEAINEMESSVFTTLDEARKVYSTYELMDAWLRYEGIQGYTRRIIESMEVLQQYKK